MIFLLIFYTNYVIDWHFFYMKRMQNQIYYQHAREIFFNQHINHIEHLPKQFNFGFEMHLMQ